MPVRSINLTDKEQEDIIGGVIPPSLLKKVQTARKPRSARYSKNKGASFQKWCADAIAKLFGIEWNNADDRSQIKTRQMGGHGDDLIMQEPLYSNFPFNIECKNCESLSIPATIEQAKANTGKGRDWLIMWNKKSFTEPIVILAWSAFAKVWNK